VVISIEISHATQIGGLSIDTNRHHKPYFRCIVVAEKNKTMPGIIQ